MKVFDTRVCALGEGPLWHPQQQRWYWFDILANRLHGKDVGGDYSWQFDECVSACGWVDDTCLLIASETQLFVFDSEAHSQRHLVALEANNPMTRSNDGRADPWGGFWIGTMGKQAEPNAGSIYRYYQDQLVCLFDQITISNAICFAPDRTCAYFCDTPRQQIMRVMLDDNGFPVGEPYVHIDLRGTDFNPDGAVVDSIGRLWNAQWGSGRIACYDSAGNLVTEYWCETTQVSCPAFGGVDATQLVVTTAAEGLEDTDANAGLCYAAELEVPGCFEHRVMLPIP